MRYGTKKWQAASCAAMGVVLAAALAGATPAAFALEDDGSAAEKTDASEESAFRLGHVAIACADADAPGGAAVSEAEEADGLGSNEAACGDRLEMGEPQERTYRITNQGETSYIRLASHTLLGELDHNNDLAVTEQVSQGMEDAEEAEGASGSADAEEAEDAGDVDGTEDAEDSDESIPSSAEPLWRFAEDGYWYRTVPLEVDEAITITVSVMVPLEEEWTAALLADASADVVETLDVQALQARNKAIDLDSPDPWGLEGTGLQSSVGAALPNEERSA